MKKLLAIIVLGWMFSGGVANSFMKYGEFKELINSKPNIAEEYIYGLSSGVRVYETFMKKYSSDNEHFYCIPEKLELTVANSINIINNKAKEMKKKKPEESINDLAVPYLYMFGLQTTFPCEN